jgi:NADH dehydrogenase [ubiquinone] 1 alpha subcomplex assembly factor 5
MTPPQIFDRTLVRLRRERSAGSFSDFSFLYDEISMRLIERLELIKRRFERALVLGARTGDAAKHLAGRFGIETLVLAESSAGMLKQADGHRVVADEEWLPFADGVFDLVVSPVSLHTTNDLPGSLAQIRRILKPDGLFLGAVFGIGTLAPLRDAFLEVEANLGVGASPHVAPFTEVRDAGGLLQRAGFALPVADAETIPVTYRNPLRLLADLRGMGESNALAGRSRLGLRRSVLMSVLAQIEAQTMPFEIVYLAGWAPDPSQQQPMARGSGQMPLSVALAKDPLT